MNNAEALIAEVSPYNPSDKEVQKALQDAGLLEYLSYTDQKKVALAAIDILVRALALSSESDHMFSQSYSLAGLKKRLYYLAKKYDVEIDLCDECKTSSEKEKEAEDTSFVRKIPFRGRCALGINHFNYTE